MTVVNAIYRFHYGYGKVKTYEEADEALRKIVTERMLKGLQLVETPVRHAMS